MGVEFRMTAGLFQIFWMMARTAFHHLPHLPSRHADSAVAIMVIIPMMVTCMCHMYGVFLYMGHQMGLND